MEYGRDGSVAEGRMHRTTLSNRAAPAPREQFSSYLGPSQIHLQHHSMAPNAPTPASLPGKSKPDIAEALPGKAE